MYNSRDIIELKGRLKKEDCTVQQFCGCYVDENKNQISRFNSKFLTLPDEEYLKWLDIMKKLFNPKELYNKNLYLDASSTFDYDFMLDPIQKGKFEENWLDAFYEMTIESVDNVGRFLILLWIDSYDVMKRSSDNLQQDESEEVYTYMTCAICPVDLDKPGLAFNSESKLGFTNKMRQWQVKNPEKGFVYPAFIDRTADRDRVLYYTESANCPDWYFPKAIGRRESRTSTEYRQNLEAIIKAIMDEQSDYEKVWMNLSYRCFLTSIEDKQAEERTKLYPDDLKALLMLDNLQESLALDITKKYVQQFQEVGYPYYFQLVDKKLVARHRAIAENNKKLKILTKAGTFIREKHGTNELTSEIDKILDSNRME